MAKEMSSSGDGKNGNQMILENLLIEELKDLYSAENQLVKALPKMSKAAHNPKLQDGFNHHLQQTTGHVKRLEQAFQMLGQQPKSKTCQGMMGLIQEGEEQIKEGKQMEEMAADLALITAAQKVEHYEISGYGSVKTMAKKIGKDDVAKLLDETENEESETDDLLTKISEPMLDQISSA